MVVKDSAIEHLISQLHHLRVEASGPLCWLMKIPSTLSSKQSEAERDSFLAKLMTSYRSASWFSDAIEEGAAEVSWVTTAEAVPHLVRENCYLGDWVLLLFASEVPYTDASPERIRDGLKNCRDALAILEKTGADVLLHSMPDDNEWLITQRH